MAKHGQCEDCGRIEIRLWSGKCESCKFIALAYRPKYQRILKLVAEGKCYAQDVANEIGISKQRASEMLKYLKDQGHLQAKPVPIKFGTKYKYECVRKN